MTIPSGRPTKDWTDNMEAIGKIGKEPLMADSNLIQMSNVARYLGRFLDQSLTFNNTSVRR